ncbi:hypothetical protein [Rhizobium rhizogenes]|uniref:hypothetical protein n=1 Tax=Rhizobium rhizogenes TaxID=359 RepID=UPI001573BD7D|nr:hypothetical protein [Rhizobium rhizogenes]NTI37138.1 hypothetical protein [Rhizobium rhizogenes]WEO68352.1 hypothetical protein G6L54_032020 [Rhizobium rhizogenes]
MIDASDTFDAGGEIHHAIEVLSDLILFGPGFASMLETGQTTPFRNQSAADIEMKGRFPFGIGRGGQPIGKAGK